MGFDGNHPGIVDPAGFGHGQVEALPYSHGHGGQNQQLVRQQEGLLDIVGDHQDGAAEFFLEHAQ